MELEDRLQDVLAQSEQQAELLNQQQGKIAELTKTIDRSTTMPQAMSTAAQRKDQMLAGARAHTSKIHEDQQRQITNLQNQLKTREAELTNERTINKRTIDHLRAQVAGVRQEKKNAVEAITRLHENLRLAKEDLAVALNHNRVQARIIDQLQANLAEARQGHKSAAEWTIDRMQLELVEVRHEAVCLQI